MQTPRAPHGEQERGRGAAEAPGTGRPPGEPALRGHQPPQRPLQAPWRHATPPPQAPPTGSAPPLCTTRPRAQPLPAPSGPAPPYAPPTTGKLPRERRRGLRGFPAPLQRCRRPTVEAPPLPGENAGDSGFLFRSHQRPPPAGFASGSVRGGPFLAPLPRGARGPWSRGCEAPPARARCGSRAEAGPGSRRSRRRWTN